MFVPMSPLSYSAFGLTFIGLGGWMAVFNDLIAIRCFGGLFLLIGVGMVAGCVWLRRRGVGWFQTWF
jgi:hypothetical protein